ncbi:MAG: ABC transporter ATP-binding protein [Candidatus Mesenet longicola]|uniref:ABC transporter ATP-binding protein n=1 Tax=Candidatus Mesenet longicola TaxID=1892558 RepID=A0A8J3HVM5_9RICK|nr:MAG: ABC transporter ATP-binding protein [Candidatus Mesenet longicola]GHM59755.1 MAG: ABC transporter ATP-binding protein [Candidatus Mesenet longicola]
MKNIKDATFRMLFQYIKPYITYFVLAYVIAVTSSLAILTLGHGIQNLIDLYSTRTGLMLINSTVFFLCTIVLVIGLSSFFRLYLAGYGSEKVLAKIRYDLYSHIINLPPSFFEDISTSDITSALTTDTVALQPILSGSMLTIVRNFITLFGSATMLFYTNFKLTVYTILIIPFILFILTLLGRKTRMLSRLVRDNISDMASFSEETYLGIVTIKSFVSEENQKRNFFKYVNEIFNLSIKLTFFRAILVALIITFVIGSVGLVFWLGIHEVLQNNMTSGALSSFIFYSVLATSSVNSIGDNINDIHRALGVAERIFELMSAKSNIISSALATKVTAVSKCIAFSNITFYYSSKRQPALNNVSFIINKGETVALVGPSGSGKSTILKLLLRFYDPNEGNITIDDTDIRSLTMESLRSLFGLVPQDHTIFSCSIMENILYGNPDATYEEVRQAAVSAYALEFIDKLPKKFESFIGNKGLKLSEGQKQRIVIARAILKNPQVLILDEATSALDSESEHLIKKALDKLMTNRTTLVIAHRLSTILKADRIIVINDGKIEEVGTHKLLIEQNGLYSKLAKLQFHCS